MLLNFKELVKKYNLQIKGIIHCGASIGQEVEDYEQLGVKNIILIEPCTGAFTELFNRYGSKYVCYNMALSDYDGEAEMFVSDVNGGQSNSLLKPALHETYYPQIVFDKKETVTVRKMDSIYHDDGRFNFLVMDCQGAEGNIIAGAAETLKTIDYIYTEINESYLYENNVLVGELDKQLCNFSRVETKMTNNGWGDSLYIKNK